ncbi:TRAP transporter small permease [Butyricicoccus sp.]|uniref:TRAP transporter small permease n=1 Tax=Butyricicoccus sp. TaxID=2049021 RepID=UPI003F136FBD
MKALTQVRNIIDKVLSAVFALIFAFMVCIGTYQIVVRYFFNSPSTVSEELLTYSFTWMALLAAAYVFGKRDHMRMSFLSDKITGKPKMILEIAIELLIMVMVGFVMIFGGFSIMQLTMTQATASLGIPMGVIYTIIPISGCIIFVYSILNIIDLLHSGSAGEGDGRKEESA